jgi:rhomboid family GlyGly-CTERM serine protease
MKRLPFLTLLLAAWTAVVQLSPAFTDALQFQRDALAQGQLWRVVTGHFTHFSADHLKWDLLAFLLFGSLVEMRSRAAWGVCLVGGSLVISLGVVLLQPQFTHYRGLSGLDSALFASIALERMRTAWRAADWTLVGVASVACLGLLAKTLFEITAGQTLFVDPDTSFEPVPLAHLLGAMVGALTVWAMPLTAALRTHSRRANDAIAGIT